MKAVKVVTQFFLLLACLYVLLMMPWPGLGRAYARLFEAGAQRVFGSFGANGVVFFLPAPTNGATFDTILLAGNRTTKTKTELLISSRATGYRPLAFLTALLLATPLPWRRILRAVAWGFLLLHACVALHLLATIAWMFSQPGPVALFNLGEPWTGFLERGIRLVAFAPFFGLVVPTVIWVLVTFRRGDVAMILGRPSPGTSHLLVSQQTVVQRELKRPAKAKAAGSSH